MFRKILYPTDFSKKADRAFEYVKKLKEAGAEEVVILHVVEDYVLQLMVTACEERMPFTEKCIKKVEHDLKAAADKRMRELGGEFGLKAEVKIAYGKPFSQIVKTAEDEKVSLIVMASHGKGEVEELLVGSVTENVIRHSKIPVLVVK